MKLNFGKYGTRLTCSDYRGEGGKVSLGSIAMNRFALIALVLVDLGCSALAEPLNLQQNSSTTSAPWPISCHLVREYVGQVGMVRARAMALAAGMTPTQVLRARRCLTRPI